MTSPRPDGPQTDAIGGRTILLLEDEPLIALDLSVALQASGATVRCAYTIRQGFEAIEQGPPDAAVLDVNLGKGDTCAPLAERLNDLGIPFVLHSGDLDRHGELISTLGAKIVPKPTHARDVIATLADVMERGGENSAPREGREELGGYSIKGE